MVSFLFGTPESKGAQFMNLRIAFEEKVDFT